MVVFKRVARALLCLSLMVTAPVSAAGVGQEHSLFILPLQNPTFQNTALVRTIPSAKSAFFSFASHGLNLSFARSFKNDRAGLDVEDGCAQWYGNSGYFRPFLSGKNTCLGDRSPWADIAKVTLLDRFNRQFSRAELTSDRPFQTRTGLILHVDKTLQLGMSYVFTEKKEDEYKKLNQLMPHCTDVAGHRAMAQLRWFWQ